MGNFWSESPLLEVDEPQEFCAIGDPIGQLSSIGTAFLHHMNKLASNPEIDNYCMEEQIQFMSNCSSKEDKLEIKVYDISSEWQYLNLSDKCQCDKAKYINNVLLIMDSFNDNKDLPKEIMLLIFKYFYGNLISLRFYQVDINKIASNESDGRNARINSILSQWIDSSSTIITYSIWYKTNIICCNQCMTFKDLNDFIVENRTKLEISIQYNRNCIWKCMVIKKNIDKNEYDNNVIKTINLDINEQDKSGRYPTIQEMTNLNRNWSLPLHEFDIIDGYIIEAITP